MDDGKPMKNSIDYMSSAAFDKFRDQFRKKVIPNMDTKQSEELTKKKKEPEEKSDEE